MGDLVADWLRRKSKVTNPVVGPAERLLTVEGEHAGYVVIDGVFDAKPVQACLGFVFGDDFYALVEGFALRADLFASTAAMVRELTLEDRHALGQRRRRYEHARLAGWQPIVRGFTTDWVSPRYPLESGLIVTYAATPVDPSADIVVGSLVARAVERGFGTEPAATSTEVKSTHQLAGVVSELVGLHRDERVFRSFVTLTDSRYLYSCELLARTERDWPGHKDAFTGLWQSIVPVPRAHATVGRAGLFEFWAD